MVMTPSTRYRQLLAMPPRRLGRFLGEEREARGETLGQVAERLEWAFTPTVLAMIERGEYRVQRDEIPQLVAGYQADLDAVLRLRDELRVDLVAGRMCVAGEVFELDERDAASDVLSQYLAFMRRLRRLPADGAIPRESLRTEDIDVLASSLRMAPAEVEKRLVALLDPASEQAREAIRRSTRQRSALAARIAEAAAARDGETGSTGA